MILDSIKLKEIDLSNEIVIADTINNIFKNIDVSENCLSVANISTDYIYTKDSNIEDMIKKHHIKSSSILYIGITITEEEKIFSCKTPIFNYNDDGIKYFVNWGDSEEDQEITPYTEAMEISHEYDVAGNFTI